MIKRVITSPIATLVFLVLAAGLIGFGSIRGVQAAPRIQSADYRAAVELTNIETALTENGVVVEGEDVLLGEERFLTPNEIKSDLTNFKFDKTYKELLGVRNVGTIDQFVRVTVYKYWTDKDGNKLVGLNPAYIKLHFIEGNGWTIDKNASTEERTVLYYTNPEGGDGSIAPGADTTLFVDSITIDGNVVKELSNGSFVYEDATFKIKATVDAVQTHNATDAMNSAWGRTNAG